jgi:hypothetical protein
MLEAYERVLDTKEKRHTAEIAELLGKLETGTTLEVENLKRNEADYEAKLTRWAVTIKELRNDSLTMRKAFRAYEASTPRETRLTDEYQRFNIDFWAYTGK